MEECFKSNHSQESYSAQIKPIDDRIPNNHIREHCLANLSQLNMIGIDRCQQVRIERPKPTGTALALYTVIDVHDEEQDVVLSTKILMIYGIDWNFLALIILLAGLTLRLRPWVLLMRRQGFQ
jgi:hypothetical protein